MVTIHNRFIRGSSAKSWLSQPIDTAELHHAMDFCSCRNQITPNSMTPYVSDWDEQPEDADNAALLLLRNAVPPTLHSNLPIRQIMTFHSPIYRSTYAPCSAIYNLISNHTTPQHHNTNHTTPPAVSDVEAKLSRSRLPTTLYLRRLYLHDAATAPGKHITCQW